MRAHRNPTRMRAIERAAEDLIRRYRSLCPACARPGFDVTERVRGLPCRQCGEPTSVFLAERLTCLGCGYNLEQRASAAATTDSSRCELCNP
jgi:ribosomal protein S27AE